MTSEPGSRAHLFSPASAARAAHPDDVPTEPPPHPDDRETLKPAIPVPGISTPVPPSRDLVITHAPDGGPDGEDDLPGNERQTIVTTHWAIAIDGAKRSILRIEARLCAIALSAGLPDPQGSDGNAVRLCKRFPECIPAFAMDPESVSQPTMSAAVAQHWLRNATRSAYDEVIAAIKGCASASDPEIQRRLAEFRQFYLQAIGKP